MTDTPDTLTEPQKLWVAALRSGRFKQTTHVLCRLDEQGEPVGYCCLGVACELAREAGVGLGPDAAGTHADGDLVVNARYYGGEYVTLLPVLVEHWLGLADEGGAYGEADASLASLNDAGETFERIADIIESRPSGLFVEAES